MRHQAFEVDHHGQTIRGMAYLPAKTGRHPTVLMLHGFTGDHLETGRLFVNLARELAAAGVAAVAFDFLHSGDSDGSFDQMLPTREFADVLRMTEWVQSQPFVDRSRLALLGMSLGGLLAACAMKKTAAYRSLVLLCPTTGQNLVNNVCRKNDGCPADAPLTYGPFRMHPKFRDDTLSLDGVRDLVQHPRPTLIVHGTADRAVPLAVAEEYLAALTTAKIPAEHLWIDDADHGFNTPPQRRELNDAVVGFLRKTLT